MLRAAITLAALALVRAQPPTTYVDVSPNSVETEEIEKRFTPELLNELRTVKDDVLLLYTEYSARTGAELKIFLKNMTVFSNQTLDGVDVDGAPPPCKEELEKRLRKIRYDASRAATFSAENHHKFFLGHMIIFRMHLNKSEEFIKKSDRTVSTCGFACETIPKVTRWRRQALNEIHRVQDDIQHSRRSFKDLATHARRKLNNLKKQAHAKAQEAVYSFELCRGFLLVQGDRYYKKSRSLLTQQNFSLKWRSELSNLYRFPSMRRNLLSRVEEKSGKRLGI